MIFGGNVPDSICNKLVYNICRNMISETVKFFKQLRTSRDARKNDRGLRAIISQICQKWVFDCI